jgi:hypothetical protein
MLSVKHNQASPLFIDPCIRKYGYMDSCYTRERCLRQPKTRRLILASREPSYCCSKTA